MSGLNYPKKAHKCPKPENIYKSELLYGYYSMRYFVTHFCHVSRGHNGHVVILLGRIFEAVDSTYSQFLNYRYTSLNDLDIPICIHAGN